MASRRLSIITLIVTLLGIGLMIGGIVTEKHGATVIGIIVAGVSARYWLTARRDRGGDRTAA